MVEEGGECNRHAPFGDPLSIQRPPLQSHGFLAMENNSRGDGVGPGESQCGSQVLA